MLRNMWIHPFFIHYYSSEQIYRNYTKHVSHPILIDATWSVVKSFKKFGNEETK